MSIYGAADTQILGGGIGGGFGGWGGGYGYGGGYGCGIAPIGLVGITDFFGRGRHDGCCDKGHGGGRHSEEVILEDAHYNSLQASISGVKDNIYALSNNIGDKFAATNAAIANVNYNQAINTKDIIHDIDIQSCNLGSKIDKCCCETNHNIDNKFFALSKQISDCCCELEKEGLKNTQAILNQLATNKEQELLARLARCEKENDFFRINGAFAANLASFKAATAGSNFNTGTQTQTTSNNSGQVVGG